MCFISKAYRLLKKCALFVFIKIARHCQPSKYIYAWLDKLTYILSIFAILFYNAGQTTFDRHFLNAVIISVVLICARAACLLCIYYWY